MNQEKISELENIICRDYNNTTGIIVLKNGRTLYENSIMHAQETAGFHV